LLKKSLKNKFNAFPITNQGPKPILFASAAAALKKWPSAAAALGSRRFFFSAAAAGAAVPIGLNENKSKIFSVHGTIYTFQLSFQNCTTNNTKYSMIDVIRAWERQTFLPSRSESRSNFFLMRKFLNSSRAAARAEIC
jgi:hypothetical protein